MKISRLLSQTLLMGLIAMISSSCLEQASPPGAATGLPLTIEEYPLTALECAADPEARCFVPASGSFEEVMATRATERALPPAEKAAFRENEFSALLEGKPLTANIITEATGETAQLIVQVKHDGQVIFTRQLGAPTPVDPLRGLWVYEGHWYLELVENRSTGVEPFPAGVIVRDGELVYESRGSDEAFGFALLGGAPFFFYIKDGSVCASYDNEPIPLGFQLVPHYGCCSAARLNPIEAEDMVSFFAERDGAWVYVEAGVYP